MSAEHEKSFITSGPGRQIFSHHCLVVLYPIVEIRSWLHSKTTVEPLPPRSPVDPALVPWGEGE